MIDDQLEGFKQSLENFTSTPSRICLLLGPVLFLGVIIWFFYGYISPVFVTLHSLYAGAMVWFTFVVISQHFSKMLCYFFVGLSGIVLFLLHPEQSVLSISMSNDPIIDYFKFGIYIACVGVVLVGGAILIRDVLRKILLGK